MIMTTTPTVEGKKITAYHGVVFGEVISGVDVIKDIAASFRDFFGGRSATYEKELLSARHEALEEMTARARQMGANAIVGIKVDYETLGEGGGMLMVISSGTAVTIE